MKKILLLLLLSYGFSSFSQEKNPPLNKQTKISLNILRLEIAQEYPITNKFSVDFGLGLGVGHYVNSTEFGRSISLKKFPSIHVRSRVRYFYNRERRLKKGRDITNNSGNYISFQSIFTTKQNATDIENPSNNCLSSELTWGLQRSLGGQWLFDFNLGIGRIKDFDSNLIKFYPSLFFDFSYIIF